jgi:hypothetical protein
MIITVAANITPDATLITPAFFFCPSDGEGDVDPPSTAVPDEFDPVLFPTNCSERDWNPLSHCKTLESRGPTTEKAQENESREPVGTMFTELK